MEECKDCKSKMALVSGYVDLDADPEPFESGLEEETDFVVLTNKYVSGYYCIKCDKIQEMWESR